MSIVLGISAYFHDSSACLVVDGEVVAAALEERFTRKKHDSSFPVNAINFCLDFAAVNSNDIDIVCYFEKPFTKFERILDTFVRKSPKGFIPFQRAVKSWVKEKIWVEDKFNKEFEFSGKFIYCQHHLSHAANACLQSGFNEAAYLIVDGVGEKACTSIGTFKEGKFEPLIEQHFPHSIGLLYSAFTQYCGFKVNSGEYKLMGLAPYGSPKYVELIYDQFISINDEGEIRLAIEKFGFLSDLKMINKKFEKVFDRPARKSSEKMDSFYMDVAASIQKVTEEILVNLVEFTLRKTGQNKLVYGGGVALNCVANAKLVSKVSSLNNLFIHSASGDGGCAMGAALWAANLKEEIKPLNNQEYLGPEFSEQDILSELYQIPNISFEKMNNSDLLEQVATHLNNDKVVGWFQGRMEFGPRALGNRSILASPKHPEMKSVLNHKIKKREGFRPFAPLVLEEHYDTYFVNNGADYTRMLYVTEGKTGDIPACIHEDNTARVQSLSKESNPILHDLIKRFYEKSGLPVLINTSFNERGEPIVTTPKDAISCFFNTDMDVLVLGNVLLLKKENSRVNLLKKKYELD